MSSDIETLLSQTTLFCDLPRPVLRAVAGACVRRTFLKGTVLFHKGEMDRTLYLIASGRLRIYVPSDSGREVTLSICGPGEAIGELALLDGLPRSACAQALDDVMAYGLNHEVFIRLLDASPLASAVIRVLATRLRHASDNVESLALSDVPGRVAQRLLELADRYGRGEEIDLDLTQTDFASFVGASREAVNKALASFRRQGLIERQGQRILIRKPDVLRRRAQ